LDISPERWQKIEHLYHTALEREPGGRSAFLDQACQGDAELRREVEALLAQGDAAGDSTVTILTAGAQLGPYQIEAPIGAGGMGSVYRAVDTRLGRKVAIKICAQQFSGRFEREARAISSLNHPHICTLYDVGPNYLVMELVEGETLAARLQKGRQPMAGVLRYAAEIADALAAAHALGIIHRDLKPQNIMITKSGVKVLDFGLAKSPRDETLTVTRAVMGTPAYMAPEQMEGKECDARSDIYALGLVLYEMAAGKRLPQGQPPVMEGLPPQFAHVIELCVESEPDNRWQSASDVKRELEWAGKIQPAPAPVPADARLHIRTRTLPWLVAAVLAVVAAVALWAPWRATRPVDRPLMRFSADLGPEAVEGVNITTAISPDGTRLAFVARGPTGKQQLATRALDQAKATVLSGTENAADPFFSPDGQWIGFFADGKMKKISVQGGVAVTLCDAPFGRGASWGEDGSIIVTLTALVGGLSRVPAAGGTPQTITKPGDKGEAVHRWPQILPGGQAVLFTGNTVPTGHDNASIEVLSLKSGQWKVVQRGGYFGRYLATSNGVGHLVYLHQGTLFAVPFDLDRLETRGTPAPLLEDVAGNAAGGGGQFDVARNGTLVYLSGKSSNASWPVAWMDSTGKTTPLLAAPAFYVNPRFSPDGKRLALNVESAGGEDIQVYDWPRDTMTRLTFTQTNLFPIWTPDGKHIAFESQSLGANSLLWIRADGAGEVQPLLQSKNDLRPYSFSPDGQRLAFAEVGVDTGRYNLWTLPLGVSDPEHPKPGKPELFLRTPFDEREPAFSPDGRWIAYSSAESGRFEVYVRPFPGGNSGSGKWQISTGGGRHPIWSRDGRELFYETSDNRIMAASYTAKADTFAADKPRLWSNTQIREPAGIWNLDLAPDGKRFAVFPRPEATGEQKGSVHVTVLLNFFDELRRRVPAGGKN
jgi:Tol biopolymer transport system component/predicted Ser/Thr protein kinase